MKLEKKYTLTASRLQEALNDAGLIAQDLVERSGIAKASISHYLNGYYCPTLKKAKVMADVLGVSPAWLMGFDVPKKEEPVPVDYVISTAQGQLLLETQDMTEHQIDHLLKYIKLLKDGGDPK